MYRAFGFRFTNPVFLVAFIALLAIGLLVYHKAIEISIRNHPEATRQAVRGHCRYLVGKNMKLLSRSEFAAELQLCEDVRIVSIDAAGGIFHPVIVKITVEDQSQLPLDKKTFIFKTSDISPGKINFLSCLNNLISGNWRFNFYNTYSETTFYGSF